MKKTKWILLIASLSSIVIGILLMVCAVAATGYHIDTLFRDKRVQHLTEINEPFNSISIDTNIDSVTFIEAEGTGAAIELYDSDTAHYDVSVQDGHLTIRYNDNRPWYSYLTLHFPTNRELKLFLPSDTYQKVDIHTNIGSVTIPDSFRIEALNVSADIGSVKVPKATGADHNSTDIHTGIGDITVNKKDSSDNNNLHIDTGIGNIHVN